MPKIDALSAVAHDIAHHAQSGLSWLYPHLGEACREAATLSSTIDLTEPQPYPKDLPTRAPLRLALGALRRTLAALLERHGFSLGDLTEAQLEFRFPEGFGDGSLYSVRSRLVCRGRAFERHLLRIDELPRANR